MIFSDFSLPDYDPLMYLRGYTPEQILQARRESMLKYIKEKRQKDEDDEVKVRLEIKK